MPVTKSSPRTRALAATILLGVILAGAAAGRADDPPAPPFNHPLGPATKASPLLRDCPLPLFDDQGRRTDQKGAIACGTCHAADAQGRIDTGALLPGKTASQLCAACHKKQARMAGTAHVMDEGCLACHQPHAQDAAEDLWTAGLETDAEYEASAACLACHDDPGWAAWPPWKLPAKKQPAPGDRKMKLVARTEPMEAHEFGCSECHDPHAKTPNHSLLADGPDRDFAKLCLNCHDEELARLAYTYHGPSRFGPPGRGTTLCGPCHRMHPPDPDRRPAAPALSLPASTAAAFSTADLTCLACHAAAADHARPAGNYTHPPLPMTNRQQEEAPGFYPLRDKDGQLGPAGRLACLTCHLPHGRQVDLDDLSAEQKRPPAAYLPPPVPLTRRYVQPNLCCDCHHPDALPRFLYFHRPNLLPQPPPP